MQSPSMKTSRQFRIGIPSQQRIPRYKPGKFRQDGARVSSGNRELPRNVNKER